MGLDIDVMNSVGVAPPEPKREPSLKSSRSIDGAPNLNSTTLLHLPEESLVPVLEDDDGRDSMSSKKSSWGPGSPHSASRLPLGPKQSVRRRRSARIFEQDDTGHLVLQEDTMMSNLDLNDDEEELLSEEDMTMEEYHKFASELASSSVRKPSHEESRPTTATQGRRSSILSFTHSRLRRKPTTSGHGRLDSSSSAEHPPQAPVPAAPEVEGVPKSGWDSDSDSEDDRTSRSIWPRGRSSNKGRDSPASMTRQDDDARGSRGWAKGGLLNVGKRRKEQPPRDFGSVDERSFA